LMASIEVEESEGSVAVGLGLGALALGIERLRRRAVAQRHVIAVADQEHARAIGALVELRHPPPLRACSSECRRLTLADEAAEEPALPKAYNNLRLRAIGICGASSLGGGPAGLNRHHAGGRAGGPRKIKRPANEHRALSRLRAESYRMDATEVNRRGLRLYAATSCEAAACLRRLRHAA
jgi:hypothetical protein